MVKFNLKPNLLLNEEFDKKLYLLIEQTYMQALEDETPVKSGEMKRNWYLVKEGDFEYVIINDTEYAKWVDEGTGIYGPHKHRILPKTKEALKFKWNGRTLIVKSVAGMKGRQIIQKVALSEEVRSLFEKGLDKLIQEWADKFIISK